MTRPISNQRISLDTLTLRAIDNIQLASTFFFVYSLFSSLVKFTSTLFISCFCYMDINYFPFSLFFSSSRFSISISLSISSNICTFRRRSGHVFLCNFVCPLSKGTCIIIACVTPTNKQDKDRCGTVKIDL